MLMEDEKMYHKGAIRKGLVEPHYLYDPRLLDKPEVLTAKFALTYTGWHSFARDKETVEVICALNNLGIIEVNDSGHFTLKSEEKARRFIDSNGKGM